MGQVWRRTPTPKKKPTEKAIKDKDVEYANLDTSEIVSEVMMSAMDAEMVIADLAARVAALEVEKEAKQNA